MARVRGTTDMGVPTLDAAGADAVGTGMASTVAASTAVDTVTTVASDAGRNMDGAEVESMAAAVVSTEAVAAASTVVAMAEGIANVV